jgi:transposase
MSTDILESSAGPLFPRCSIRTWRSFPGNAGKAPFITGAAESLPNAQITFDKFHVVKLINEAVDAVRRAEQKSHAELKKSRYLWLKNPCNLSERQRTQLDNLAAANLKTGRAYRIRLAFQELYLQPAKDAEELLKKWYWWATHSRLPPMI